MVILEFDERGPSEVPTDAVAVFATEDDGRAVPTLDAERLGQQLGIDIAAELAAIRFEGGLGKVARLPTRGAVPAALALVVGVGRRSDANLETLRKAAGAAARNAAKNSSLAVVVPVDVVDADPTEITQAVAEGAGLGAYAFTTYRTKTVGLPSLERLTILAGNDIPAAAAGPGVQAADRVVRATALARDLVNEPPAGKRPPALAERIAEIARAAGLRVRVFDETELAKEGFGGILAVGQGSSTPPRLVELTFQPPRASGHIVLVGKGITFDSGGLSLKPSASMATMKSDMSGAAAVVGAMSVLGEANIQTKVTGLLALAENMPSGEAVRVSDVIRHRGGKTVEVMNTDAEGRLVLGDALAYGAELAPDAMIDIATLTGAQVVALGMKIAALMATSDELAQALLDAAGKTGEQFWRLPLPPEYAEHLKSEVADLRNIGKQGQAGTLIGGLFLKEFVGDVPWAHLDIAGPAFTDEGDGFYTSKGATGAAVRTLIRFLQDRA